MKITNCPSEPQGRAEGIVHEDVHVGQPGKFGLEKIASTTNSFSFVTFVTPASSADKISQSVSQSVVSQSVSCPTRLDSAEFSQQIYLLSLVLLIPVVGQSR